MDTNVFWTNQLRGGIQLQILIFQIVVLDIQLKKF